MKRFPKNKSTDRAQYVTDAFPTGTPRTHLVFWLAYAFKSCGAPVDGVGAVVLLLFMEGQVSRCFLRPTERCAFLLSFPAHPHQHFCHPRMEAVFVDTCALLYTEIVLFVANIPYKGMQAYDWWI